MNHYRYSLIEVTMIERLDLDQRSTTDFYSTSDEYVLTPAFPRISYSAARIGANFRLLLADAAGVKSRSKNSQHISPCTSGKMFSIFCWTLQAGVSARYGSPGAGVRQAADH